MFSIDDNELIRLYQARTEDAVAMTELRYGAYCRRIAVQILGDPEDAKECVNDVWFKAWNGIPNDPPQPILQASAILLGDARVPLN